MTNGRYAFMQEIAVSDRKAAFKKLKSTNFAIVSSSHTQKWVESELLTSNPFWTKKPRIRLRSETCLQSSF